MSTVTAYTRKPLNMQEQQLYNARFNICQSNGISWSSATPQQRKFIDRLVSESAQRDGGAALARSLSSMPQRDTFTRSPSHDSFERSSPLGEHLAHIRIK